MPAYQNDMIIANDAGLAVRNDITSALQALAALSKGPTAPATPYPGQFWLDDANAVLKQRTLDNTAWMVLGAYDTVLGALAWRNPATVALASGFTVAPTDDGRLFDIDASSGAATVVLPPVASVYNGFRVGVRKADTSANAITLDPDAGETIDLTLLYLLEVPFQQVWVRCTATQWLVESATRPSPTPCGQCKLVYVSAGTITLLPWGGTLLTLAGADRRLPAAGVSLAATGLSVNTLYYVYAYWTGSAVALEASTTGYTASQFPSGLATKSTDPSRTLVGMVYPTTGPAFQVSATAVGVRSWFNDDGFAMTNVLGSGVNVTSAPWVEITTALRVSALCWAGETVSLHGHGFGYNGSATTTSYLWLNRVGSGSIGNQAIATSPAGYSNGMVSRAEETPGEGFWTWTLMGGVSTSVGPPQYQPGYTGIMASSSGVRR